MSGKKDKKSINLIGGGSQTRKKVVKKTQRRGKPAQTKKERSRGRRG